MKSDLVRCSPRSVQGRRVALRGVNRTGAEGEQRLFVDTPGNNLFCSNREQCLIYVLFYQFSLSQQWQDSDDVSSPLLVNCRENPLAKSNFSFVENF